MRAMYGRAKDLYHDKSGASSLTNFVIALAVGIILLAYLIPVAIDQFVATNTDTWEDEWSGLWDIIPIFVFLGILISIIYMAVYRRK